MKKIGLIFLVYIFGLIYLTLPSPVYPDLTGGIRSDEPGDTWQNPDQKGFYTNLDRANVLQDIQSQFVIKFLGFSLPSFRLNYQPEEAYPLVRDQLPSYYLEEIIYPFRESIFVNGWEPRKSPIYAGRPDSIIDISYKGVVYNSKVTLKPNSSPLWARVLIWTLTFPVFFVTYLSWKKSISKNV